MADLPALPAELVGAEPAIAGEINEALIVDALRDASPEIRGWYPATTDEAEWCMRKLAALQGHAAEVEREGVD